MFTTYVIVTVVAAAANGFSATLDFIRFRQVLINMARAGMPESWITVLGDPYDEEYTRAPPNESRIRTSKQRLGTTTALCA